MPQEGITSRVFRFMFLYRGAHLIVRGGGWGLDENSKRSLPSMSRIPDGLQDSGLSILLSRSPISVSTGSAVDVFTVVLRNGHSDSAMAFATAVAIWPTNTEFLLRIYTSQSAFHFDTSLNHQTHLIS